MTKRVARETTMHLIPTVGTRGEREGIIYVRESVRDTIEIIIYDDCSYARHSA